MLENLKTKILEMIQASDGWVFELWIWDTDVFLSAEFENGLHS